MSRARAPLSLAAALLAAHCARPSPQEGATMAPVDAADASASAPAASASRAVAPALADAPVVAVASVVADASVVAVAPLAMDSPSEDPVARGLSLSPILTLRPTGAQHDGRFSATVSLGDAPSGGAPRAWRVRAAAAQKRNPIVHRRPLAFYRLARALGARTVPAAAVQRIGVGEIAALLEHQPASRALLRRLAIMNDGTVDVLLSAPAPGPPGPRWDARGRTIQIYEAPELKACARWARSPTAVPGERSSLLRDYIEMLMLDYLAGNALREEVVIDDGAGALILQHSADAFPLHVKANALDRQLRLLADAARFPRALHDALVRFDRDASAEVLRPSGFDDEFLPPRALSELEDRRATLLSLIDAKIALVGADAALSL